MPYTPERDLHGEVIADLSTAEIQRRLAVIGGDTSTPREIDTKLAEVHGQIYKAEDRLNLIIGTMARLAGAEFYYRGRQRVTDMKLDEAIAKLTERATYVAEYKAANAYVEETSYGTYHGTNWDTFKGTPYDADEPAETLAKYNEQKTLLADLNEQAAKLDASYTGWSRFFLVTSSAGHVHSSTCCSTCRPTTRYGWLPQLSGQTEAQAVSELGPTLCTICFPSAPLDWTSGKKLTAAQAAKKAA